MEIKIFKSRNYFISPLINSPEFELRIWSVIITIVLLFYILAGYDKNFITSTLFIFWTYTFVSLKKLINEEKKIRIKINAIPFYPPKRNCFIDVDNIENYHIVFYEKDNYKYIIDVQDRLDINDSKSFFIFKLLFLFTYGFINLIFPVISLIIIYLIPFISSIIIKFIIFFLLFTISYIVITLICEKSSLKHFIDSN